MGKFDKIIVIIPALNPNEKIITLVDNLRMEGFNEIVVIDDGSNVENQKYFELLRNKENITIIKNTINLGKGKLLSNLLHYYIIIYIFFK